jgi:hypothetical protein
MRNEITVLTALLLAMAVTSCGRAGADASAAAGEDATLLGTPPAYKPNPMPTSVWFSLGDQTYSADKLVELAIQRITKEEGTAPYAGARADVFFRTDDKEVLAEVAVGQIMKPTWTITFSRSLKVLRYRKGVGRG